MSPTLKRSALLLLTRSPKLFITQMHHCGFSLVRCMHWKKCTLTIYMLVQHGVTFSIPTQYRHYTHRKQWYEGMFVDPVKQGLPKIFLSQVNHTTNSVTKPTAPSRPYIPRLVPIACGFCNEIFIAVYEYSLQCECSYKYAIGSWHTLHRDITVYQEIFRC